MEENQEKTITISLNKNVITYVLVGLLVVASFIIGNLWNRVQNLENAPRGNQYKAANNAPTPSAPPQAPIVKPPLNSCQPFFDWIPSALSAAVNVAFP